MKTKTGFIPHVANNRGQAPEILNVGDPHFDRHERDMETALENWRKENYWAAHIPYADLPLRFKETISLAADIMAGARS